ncbi:MAG TPA: hypothetical protein VGM89_13225 [Puia sp.]
MEPTPLAPKPRPPYLLGLICLIPLIGGLLGFILLLLGIIHYKDRRMIIIGAAGIFWTIIVYFCLFQFIAKSDTVRGGFVSLSALQLNQLVADIELYKLQRGHYPDSLMQLRSINLFAPITDPIQNFSLRSDRYFNYGRVGDKYYLFSSGTDGIPHTKDDFYPKLEIPDSSKIGLIRDQGESSRASEQGLTVDR